MLASNAARTGVRTFCTTGSGFVGVCWAVPGGYRQGVYARLVGRSESALVSDDAKFLMDLENRSRYDAFVGVMFLSASTLDACTAIS